MNKCFFFYLLLLIVGNSAVKAQRKQIDINAIKRWNSIGDYGISNDGKFIWYEVRSDEENLLVVQNVENGQRAVYPRCSRARFTSDSKFVMFNALSAMVICRLPGFDTTMLNGREFKIPARGNEQWLGYLLDSSFVLRNLENMNKKVFGRVEKFLFNDYGTRLALVGEDSIHLLDLMKNTKSTFCMDGRVSVLSFDNKGEKLVFVVHNGGGCKLYYYDVKLNDVSLLLKDTLFDVNRRLKIADSDLRFDESGELIFFKAKECKIPDQPDNNLLTNKVNIWHYKDVFLQSQQAFESGINKERLYSFAFVVKTGKVFNIENTDIRLKSNPNKYYAITTNVTSSHEAYWRKDEPEVYFLHSLKDGSKKEFIHDKANVHDVRLSQSERFVSWSDTVSGKTYCYEISSGITRDISADVSSNSNLYNEIGVNVKFDLLGWLSNDNAILVHDWYDIWQLDPLGKKSPICLTGGYGRANNVLFRTVDNKYEMQSFNLKDSILVTAFDNKTKQNGFLKIKLSVQNQVSKLNLQPFAFYHPIFSFGQKAPIKAKNKNLYVLLRQSFSEAPNLVVTRDFVEFKPVSNIAPQQEYNWYTSELYEWRLSSGKTVQGMLFKPKDFDPQKKYPIIFSVYQKVTQNFFGFIRPALSEGDINMPWYVSRGYLFFMPDIPREAGHTGHAAFDAVVGAANFLVANCPWVDAKRMGIQGHSFGGFETNYIITQTPIFAAAQSSSGGTDLVSMYGGLGFGAKSLQGILEIGQTNIRTTPWESAKTYIDNSPIFHVDKITTPLLMMHNDQDGVVPFAQAIEFFTALRRLGKQAWLIQYDGEDHILPAYDKPALDFTIRQQQFFDHFLKGMPAPTWIEKGIPECEKGIRSGL